MGLEITQIKSQIANCYLLKNNGNFFLVDSGFSWYRRFLLQVMDKAGCKPGDLKLVIITHADFDHTGNCTWLQKKYRVPVALHPLEAPVVEKRRMLLNRKSRRSIVARAAIYLLGLLIFRPFKPDIYLEEGSDLSRFGLDARIYHIPGHSTGSLGVLVENGQFFCGDLLTNEKKPGKSTLVDDDHEMDDSIDKLKKLGTQMIYPGHGRPFKMAEYLQNTD